ncbi:uncharacterized protein B0H64DRAFT_449170 [Chaetomium fimeti]|uniref:Uncharacterized protein n=1 Tax=Chaetomium fimeti TaxID=1854472 RepID=A0AAE0HQC3_9PEZI|nr:hypothetical protein B0H64DRAFT_449170 [Chaetomium fimeti]
MAPQNAGPCPSSSSRKLFPDLAIILNPFLHFVSLQMSTTLPTEPHVNEAEESSAKRRKTVDFSAKVEMRHVDEKDGSVLAVETRDLHPDSDEEDPAYLGLTNAIRNIDKSLFFISRTDYDENVRPVIAYPADKSWNYGTLDDLQSHYTERYMVRVVADLAHRFQHRSSSILLALSRIVKRIEDVKETKHRELGETEGGESESSGGYERLLEMLDQPGYSDGEKEVKGEGEGEDDGENDKENVKKDSEDEGIEFMATRARRTHGRVTGRKIVRGGSGRGSTGGESASNEGTGTGSVGRGGVGKVTRRHNRARYNFRQR